MAILLLTADLMCSSQLAAAAERAGLSLQTASSPASLVTLAAAAGDNVVLLDLSLPGLDPLHLVPQLRAAPHPPRAILAFGPHVHEARLAAAAQAGCDAVFSRGQFYAQAEP